ncbi:hypothetical protein FJY63_04455 [Candidatus Sumerlaeota bacterium]|nr:hypothetical protein [Candidatus Sumerlaeota bacterium]
MRPLGLLAVVALVVLAGGCALYSNDRAWVWDSDYEMVRDLYDRCGSINVVERVLRERQWTSAQVREVRYRLMQDYSLDEKGVPRAIERPRRVGSRPQPPSIKLGTATDRSFALPSGSPVR